ncbi:DNA gyrase/topoisomerase IV subunit A [Pampinifervens florentissimum]|uniref:DNA gyrase/topoisomerase IV subunit A n=1 Tax=Pampinifervens florentissimum TaxID=1632019 RepID=UPI0013B4879E|nr:DNA topoisomerase (ATP-hydrolyzing) [Hydrogenobacter sp. T-8]QID33477.1 DNA topoisomerase 4 subunit A [Hydrogenobacter sp. T-8]
MEVITVPIEEEVKQSYIDYAMSVIVGRAIPDVRDGLKPVQRRILYAMHDMGLYPEKAFVKSARIVGAVLGYYHPHGDQAVYEALVRMAQDFNMNYPLVIGQGNFGSVDGDPPAAMRYTEAKLSKYAVKLLEDIDKNTVDFVPNFDGSTLEPSVLPSKFPNLLCNGTSGIAVGLATSIPSHNLREVCQALIELAKNPDLTTEEIMKYIKGPDFPTGGIVENYSELIEFYEKGKGQVRIRAKAHVERIQGGREQVVITELPYQVNKADLIKRMADLAREGKLKEISDIRDESDKEGIRIVVELKREAKGEKVLEKLYKYTALRKNFPLNFVVLVRGEPKLLGIKALLQEFMAHRLEVILRRSNFYLQKAKERLHIVEGLLIALKNLDSVIQDIRSSADTQEARERLMKNYGLSHAQANAVLDMRLQRLTSLERSRLEEEEKELRQKIEYYTKLVEREEERVRVFIEEMQEMSKTFSTPRRTLVEGLQAPEEGSLTVVVYARGRVAPLEEIEEGEEVVNILEVPFTDGLFMVSDRGRVYWIAGSQALKGSLLSLKEPEERIVGAFVRSGVDGRILLATEGGYVKKIPLVDFEYKSQGMQIIKFSEEDDRVVKVVQAPEEGDIILFTHRGRLLRFPVGEVPPASAGSRGVQGIKLEKEDRVVGIRALRDAEYLLVITENGGIKKVSLQEIPQRGRYTKGVEVLGSMRERLVDVIPIRGSVELMLVSFEGKVFYDRIEEKDLPLSRLDQRAKKRWELGEDRLVRVVVKG